MSSSTDAGDKNHRKPPEDNEVKPEDRPVLGDATAREAERKRFEKDYLTGGPTGRGGC